MVTRQNDLQSVTAFLERAMEREKAKHLLLQGIGESVEPVIFAMVRDYFPRNEERFMIVSALQMMSTVGMLLAPVLGGYSAELCSWRASFVVLSALWAVMAAYAGLNMVETCPDADPEQPGPGPSWSRFLNWHCLSLLLTESCNMAAYMTFSTNVSYFIEVAHSKSTMTCSTVMLAFGALNAGGLFQMERLPLGDTLQKAKTSVSLYAASGVLFLSWQPFTTTTSGLICWGATCKPALVCSPWSL